MHKQNSRTSAEEQLPCKVILDNPYISNSYLDYSESRGNRVKLQAELDLEAIIPLSFEVFKKTPGEKELLKELKKQYNAKQRSNK